MIPKAFWKLQTIRFRSQFVLLITLDLVCCDLPTTLALDTPSSASVKYASLNPSRIFPLPKRNEATTWKENSAANSLDLYSHSIHDIGSGRVGFSLGHRPDDFVVREAYGRWAAPIVFRLYPRSGPKVGGTKITFHGTRFISTGREVCCFGLVSGCEEHDLVRAHVVSETRLTCDTPRRNNAGGVVVSLSLDGVVFSSSASPAVPGSGVFMLFTFTDHVPSGDFSVDNSTGPFSGGTQITITLNVARSGENLTTVHSNFNFTKRVYLGDINSTISNNSFRSEGNHLYEAHIHKSNQHAQVVYKGSTYKVIYPSSGTLDELGSNLNFIQDLDTEDILGSYLHHNSSLVTTDAVEHMAMAMQNASRKARGCISSTFTRTVDCISSLEPHILVTDQRILEYFTHQNHSSPVTYGRFEPSSSAKCMFSFPGKLWPFESSIHTKISEIVTTPARWIGYNRIQCTTPHRRRAGLHANLSSARRYGTVSEIAVIRVSNDGIHYSEAVGTFTFNNTSPNIFNVYTKQEAGVHRARGPWSGNTEIYINGTDLLPSDNLRARFFVYNETGTNLDDEEVVPVSILEQRIGRCYFDTYEQIRCISPSWYPDEQLLKQRGSLAPCFRANVEVSNDGGMHWSSAEDKFLYCPIFVSTYGSNSWGEGTPRLPFRDISRAIRASLSHPRSYFIRKGAREPSDILGGRQQRGVEGRGSGLVSYINLDQILLMDGIYQDRVGIFGPEQNLNLAAHGQVIEVAAQNPGRAFLDCDGKDVDALRPFSSGDHHGLDVEQHGSISFKDVGIVRCAGSIRWEAYESHGKHELYRKRRKFISLAIMSTCECARQRRSDLIDALEPYVAAKSEFIDEDTLGLCFCHHTAKFIGKDADYIELRGTFEEILSVAVLAGAAISSSSRRASHTFAEENATAVRRRRLLQLRSYHLSDQPGLEAISFHSNAQAPARINHKYSKGVDALRIADLARDDDEERTWTLHLERLNFRHRFHGSRERQ